MSTENHPSLHVINVMFEVDKTISDNVRGRGLGLTKTEVLEIARILAEKAEELVDERLLLRKL